MEILRKYGTQTDIYFPLIDAGTNNFAGSGDFTHSAGDTKISKDGGAAANTTNAPTAIAMGNASMWKLTLTATEMQAAKVMVTVSDAATKAVEDQMIPIATYGNASAEHAFDLDTATQNVNVSSFDTGAITAAAIAADAIGASELAADAVAEIADAVWDEATTGHVTAGTFGEQVKTDIDAILVDTAEIGAAGAGLTTLATAAALATVDTNVDAILVDTGTTLPATLGTPSDLNGGATLADNLADIGAGIIFGTAQTGTLSTTVMTTDLTGYVDDELIGRVVVWTGGTAAGQASDITDYASASGTVTYTAITTAPANGDTFKIV